MNQDRAPLIAAGQIYLNVDESIDLEEYLIVTKNTGGLISYKGPGFTGMSDDESFIERFQPVDVADVEPHELEVLLSFCAPGTKPSTGFIAQD